MEHLTSETLARLVDERPNPSEREHIHSCARCAQELRAFGLQSESLGELTAIRPPAGDWESLEARLVSEGLIRTEESFRRFGFAAAPAWMQGAAAVVLFLGGTGFGLAVTTRGEAPDPFSLENMMVPLSRISTADEAAQTVQFAEQTYMQALVRFRQLAGGNNEFRFEDPLSRVAALEGLLAASQEALRLAPADPVFNGFLVNVLAERQETLRQISVNGADNWF